MSDRAKKDGIVVITLTMPWPEGQQHRWLDKSKPLPTCCGTTPSHCQTSDVAPERIERHLDDPSTLPDVAN
jgi:hypothetical protein